MSTLRNVSPAKPTEEWRGSKEFVRLLQEMTDALVHKVPEDIAVAMANLQGFIDWFQVDNGIELCPQRIESEFNRYEEQFSETTERRWPPEGFYGRG